MNYPCQTTIWDTNPPESIVGIPDGSIKASMTGDVPISLSDDQVVSETAEQIARAPRVPRAPGAPVLPTLRTD